MHIEQLLKNEPDQRMATRILNKLRESGIEDTQDFQRTTCIEVNRSIKLGKYQKDWVVGFLIKLNLRMSCGCPTYCALPEYLEGQGLHRK